MRFSPRTAIAVAAVSIGILCAAAWAQVPSTYSNIGTTPTEEQIKAWDIGVSPDGQQLPPGSGNAKDGERVYTRKCMVCHGEDLGGTVVDGIQMAPPLVGGKGSLAGPTPLRTIGSIYPFATTVWDFINRAMPRGNTRTLTPTEVYAVTAYLLYKNEIIKDTDVMDAKSLPKVQMPNRNNMVPVRVEDIADRKKRGCTRGQCPNGP